MTKAGEKLLAAVAEMVEIAKGERPAARIYQNGHAYVPEGSWPPMQPMEAAPKDGRILVLDGVDGYSDAEWHDGQWCIPGASEYQDLKLRPFPIFDPQGWWPLPKP